MATTSGSVGPPGGACYVFVGTVVLHPHRAYCFILGDNSRWVNQVGNLVTVGFGVFDALLYIQVTLIADKSMDSVTCHGQINLMTRVGVLVVNLRTNSPLPSLSTVWVAHTLRDSATRSCIKKPVLDCSIGDLRRMVLRS